MNVPYEANPDVALKVAQQIATLSPDLIGKIKASSWYDESELWSWEIDKPGRRDRSRPIILTKSLAHWIVNTARKNPLSHHRVNGGFPSSVLAHYVLLTQLGISPKAFDAKWGREQRWAEFGTLSEWHNNVTERMHDSSKANVLRDWAEGLFR